ncbi:MAG: N-acetyl sugar amidotransferase [Acetobacterales bacterium]
MKYCVRCVLPDTRPGIEFDDKGVCSGCRAHERKSALVVDWEARTRELDGIVAHARARRAPYDCIVPVSGGKDSTWQVIRCKELGLKVLAVTWRTPGRTAVGQRNLDNLIRFGVDHIDFSIDPGVESRFMLRTLEETGSSGVPMHLALYGIPLKLAVRLGVPLVVWGESPFMEYGGDPGDTELNKLDHAWLRRHGILQGRLAEDWAGPGLSLADLEAYTLPSREDFERADTQSIFLGYYLPWDPETSLAVATAHGFERRTEGPRLGLYDYADIDCRFISVHHWFKWPKFGMTRLFDNLSLEIRNGRINRQHAVAEIARRGDQRPVEDIAAACAFMEIPVLRFREIEDRWRNTDIWQRDSNVWRIPGFIVEDWDWSDVPAR